jgi:alkanesulfonate monooxygenase SsuD/methylene tetrahydromethanopterin reductase-like flavin-dependent oxidoreductase (luciferase family)
MPTLSARLRVEPGADARDVTPTDPYALRGTPDQMRAEIAEWAAVGVTDLALYFSSVEPEAITRDVDWWVREVGLD